MLKDEPRVVYFKAGDDVVNISNVQRLFTNSDCRRSRHFKHIEKQKGNIDTSYPTLPYRPKFNTALSDLII